MYDYQQIQLLEAKNVLVFFDYDIGFLGRVHFR